MSNTLQPIKPLEYISSHDPIPESVFNVEGWFATETLEMKFGEYVGRPSEFIEFHKSDLMYFLANGWYVDAVLSSGSDGKWESVSSATASNSSNSNSSSSSSSSATSNAQSQTPIDTLSMSNGNSTGTSASSGKANSSGSSENSVKQDGGPYWATWTKMRLKRRRLQSERILKDMIADFTKSYNEGRTVNNDRYNELVSLYSIMLSRTENEANNLSLSTDDFKPLADAVINSVKEALTNFKNAADGIPEDWMQSRIDDINRKYDALVGQAKAKMVSEGTYNTTVWPTTISGIEHERSHALNALKDDMVTVKIDAYGKIGTITSDIGKKLLDCEIALIEAQNKMLLGPTEIRNTVFKWMLDFMERREDQYPSLEKISDLAVGLGYSEGAVGGQVSS